MADKRKIDDSELEKVAGGAELDRATTEPTMAGKGDGKGGVMELGKPGSVSVGSSERPGKDQSINTPGGKN